MCCFGLKQTCYKLQARSDEMEIGHWGKKKCKMQKFWLLNKQTTKAVPLNPCKPAGKAVLQGGTAIYSGLSRLLVSKSQSHTNSTCSPYSFVFVCLFFLKVCNPFKFAQRNISKKTNKQAKTTTLLLPQSNGFRNQHYSLQCESSFCCEKDSSVAPCRTPLAWAWFPLQLGLPRLPARSIFRFLFRQEELQLHWKLSNFPWWKTVVPTISLFVVPSCPPQNICIFSSPV